MRVKEILQESKMKDLAMIIDAAEARAYDESAESGSAVHGDTILGYALEELKTLGLSQSEQAAAENIIAKEITGRSHG